jgi:hypothetical protein
MRMYARICEARSIAGDKRRATAPLLRCLVAQEQSQRQDQTTPARDETEPPCLQHEEPADRVGGPRLEDGSPPAQERCLGAPEDEQLPLHGGQDGAAAAYPRSHSQGLIATSGEECPYTLATTSSGSSGLFDSTAKDDLYERAAASLMLNPVQSHLNSLVNVEAGVQLPPFCLVTQDLPSMMLNLPKVGAGSAGPLSTLKPSAQSGTKPLPIPAGRLRER